MFRNVTATISYQRFRDMVTLALLALRFRLPLNKYFRTNSNISFPLQKPIERKLLYKRYNMKVILQVYRHFYNHNKYKVGIINSINRLYHRSK